ncbi:MAG: sigma 54-interacting transcriptional regulator [Treponema sp.]|nr:sigma 54-interacting transcriptional regulator [Treponema sp.]
MSAVSLSVIHNFIQVAAQAASDALEIETSVVDLNLVRIAGTVSKKVPQVISNGAIKTVLETGQYYLTHDTKSDLHCLTCTMRERCGETAFVHCPIFYKGQVIGVMGLMCMDDEQRRHLTAKSRAILAFVQHIGDTISLKLEEYENQQREKELYRQMEFHSAVLDHILNSISDGYLIMDNHNNITQANQPAKAILGISSPDTRSERLARFLQDIDRPSDSKGSCYDEILIDQKYYGVRVDPIFSNNTVPGKIIRFKVLSKTGTGAMPKTNPPIALHAILGESPGIIRLKDLITKSAENNLPVLLTGESGTGKELIARAIHTMSRRREHPFMALNCAAIPENLLESELFGFEQGSFTGAIKGGKPGKFELANKGTLFLDEIGDMPLALQAKLLRVLQDFVIERIGSTKPRQVDLRIIAATNQNLDIMMKEGTFRVDLFYRLNVIPIAIPSLRERGDDVVLLAEHFLKKYSGEPDKAPPKQLAQEVFDLFRVYPWPGNIRELENLIQYLVFICTDTIIEAASLPAQILLHNKYGVANPAEESSISELKYLEMDVILKTVAKFGNTTEGKLKAARALGIGKTTLYRKLAELKKN